MHTRNLATRALGTAVALSLVTAYGVNAQDTTRTRSSQRIPVRKEAGGEVTRAMPTPTVRVDTVMMTRVDTVTRTETQTVTKYDTVTVTREIMPTFHYPGGMYIGFSGGPSAPTRGVRDAYSTGYNINVPVGWQSTSGAVAVQLDLGYTRWNGKEFALNTGTEQLKNDSPSIMSASGNLKLAVPIIGPKTAAVYLIGGGGVHRFSNYSGFFARGGINAATATRRNTALTHWDGSTTVAGANAGVGASFSVGLAQMFVESRYNAAFTKNDVTTWLPLNVGVNFFGRGGAAR